MTIDEALQLAASQHNRGRLREAEAIYRQILSADPNHTQAMRLLALLAAQVKRPADAAALLRRALTISPGDPQLHFDLGNALAMLQRTDEAIESFRRATQLRPAYFEAHNNLAHVLVQCHRHDEAIESSQRTILLRPNCAEGFYNLGNALSGKRQLDQAIESYASALRLRPNWPEALYNCGNAYLDLGRLTEAADFFRRAAQLQPNWALAHYNLGTALLANDDLDRAAASFARAVELRPEYVEAINNLGSALRKMGRNAEALATFERGLRVDPTSAELHWNRAFSLLLSGDFAEGFREYEWRWQWTGFGSARRTDIRPSRWHGQSLEGKAILLLCEQGIGDQIQFMRFFPQLQARGGEVIVECPAPLRRLVERMPAVDAAIAPGETPAKFDLHCPLMSLALELGVTSADAIPNSLAYLAPEAADVEKWKARIGEQRRRKVGLVWAGNPTHRGDRQRSIPLALLAPLADESIAFYSLQKGDAARQTLHPPAGMCVIDFADELNDFADTAALIANLDLVIAVDTAVTHLAGAMGKPVWTLIPFAPDWRWGLGGSRSPWYPTMRLFRQRSRGDWKSTIAKVAAELSRWAEERG